MSHQRNSPFSKFLASGLTAALILLSPGLGAYEALAANLAAAAAKGVSSVPGGTIAAGLGAAARVAPAGLPINFPANASLTGSLVGVKTPLPSLNANFISPLPAAQSAGVQVTGTSSAAGRFRAANTPTGGGHTGPKNGNSSGQTKGRMDGLGSLREGNVRGIAGFAAEDVGEMSPAEAHSAGARLIDKLLGRRSVSAEGAVARPVAGRFSALASRASNLRPAAAPSGEPGREAPGIAGSPSRIEKTAPPGAAKNAPISSRHAPMLLVGSVLGFAVGAVLVAALAHVFFDGFLAAAILATATIGGILLADRLAGGSAASPSRPKGADGLAAARAPNAPPGGSKALGLLKSAVTIGAGALAVWGLHAAALALLPGVFGALPIAAVWAVSSGVFILPLALYSRYRLSLRDSARLKGVKLLTDLSIGALLGSVAVAAPVFLSGAVLEGFAIAVPGIVGLTYAATAQNQNSDGAVGGWINAALAWVSLNLLAPFIATAAGALPISLGSLFGLMAIAVLTTVSFFLGRVIFAAESGRPFSVPGFQQKIRFPSYTWVMTGVVFALLTGYTPVWTNLVFVAWMLLGSSKWFNYGYLGLLAWSAATGFSAPVTFLALAFLPERASLWTETLLERMLPAGAPAPSSGAETKPFDPHTDAPEKWPKFRYALKTALIIAALAGAGFVLGQTVFGFKSLFVNLGIASAFSVLPLFFSKWLIKKTMRAEPMLEERDPEIYGIMRELRERINADRAAAGKKPIPMPEMVNVPMPVPNAFATGITPFHAMVGVTVEMKDMTLNPERTREGLVRLLYAVDPQSKSFHVFKRAIRGSLSGIREDAGPQEIIQALQDAEASQIKVLGVRALRGVMGHEFNHVMHYDMLLGALTGSIASAISFASYGVLWAAGHAEALLKGMWEKLTGKDAKAGTPARGKPPVRTHGESAASMTPEAAPGPVKPEVVEPVAAATGIAVLLGLAKIFAALWAPVMARLLQMASGRTREGHADEGGAGLTGDPESLALGLGLLTSWRPRTLFSFDRALLPRLASQANVMTVNPIDQLREAGALPGQAPGAKGRNVTKRDDWFFNLFLTHPDTTQRIERLHDMAEALAAKAVK